MHVSEGTFSHVMAHSFYRFVKDCIVRIDDKLTIFFLICQKIDFDIACKFSP